MWRKPRIVLGVLDGHEPAISCSNIARSSTLILLLTSAVLWTLFYQYCRFASSRDPTSYFFNHDSGYERRYSLHREHAAYTFIESANTSSHALIKSSTDPFICLGIATIARSSSQQYVRGTVGSLLEGLTPEERKSIYLMPFVANTDPEDHPIFHEPWLAHLSDRILEYDVSEDDLAKLRRFGEGHHFRNKSMYDYGYLLEKCYDTGASWVAMIEDDVLARSGWYPDAQRALRRLQTSSAKGHLLYLRMFYTEALLGWNSEEWARYLGWSFVSLLVLLSILLAARIRSKRINRLLPNLNVAILCFVCLPAFVSLYFMAGRITMQPPAPGIHEMNRFGCCSQGFIFPRIIVPRLIERTKKAMDEDYYVDMLLERWADAEELRRFVLVPSLLQHVGRKSSKGWGYDESASTTWNFGFEDHSP